MHANVNLFAAGGLHTVDYVVIVAYFAAMIAIGVYVSGKQSSGVEYFIAGRSMPWLAVGLSLFSALLSTISYLAVPGETIHQGTVDQPSHDGHCHHEPLPERWERRMRGMPGRAEVGVAGKHDGEPEDHVPEGNRSQASADPDRDRDRPEPRRALPKPREHRRKRATAAFHAFDGGLVPRLARRVHSG